MQFQKTLQCHVRGKGLHAIVGYAMFGTTFWTFDLQVQLDIK